MEKRITKSMNFEDMTARLLGKPTPHGTTLEQSLDFIQRELNLLAKKNSGEKKPTKTQEENVAIKNTIHAFLTSSGSAMTVTVLQKTCPELEDFSNQKISAILRQLIDDGKVTREIVKRVSFFKAV